MALSCAIVFIPIEHTHIQTPNTTPHCFQRFHRLYSDIDDVYFFRDPSNSHNYHKILYFDEQLLKIAFT